MDDLLNSAPCGVLLFDDSGTILSVNKTLADWLGYCEADLIGKSIDTILTVASRIFYNTHFFPLVKLQSKADEIFLTLVSKERKDIPVLCNTLRRNNNGHFDNLTVFMPVFQRKKYEEQILQARRVAEKALKENKELEVLTNKLESHTRKLDKQNRKVEAINQDIIQFSKIVSHDLKEPIRKIKLFTSMLSSETDRFSERSKSALKKIEASADRLIQLTSGLQQYVNVDVEKSYSLINLSDSLSAALQKVKQSRNFNRFELISERLPSIEGYPNQLELLFYHLLDNAIQFRKKDEDLKVRVAHTLLEENVYHSIQDKYKFVEHVRIIFSDNGSGFDDQYKDYVFDLIKKVHPGSKGLGIGLALIKKIVDIHGGSIQIQSEPGKGTKVILVLPLFQG